jgi:hypothetical protein
MDGSSSPETDMIAASLEEERPTMDYFAGLDVSMEETHVCVVDREGAVIHEVKVPSTPADIKTALAEAPACRRVVFETGRMAPMLSIRDRFPMLNRDKPWRALRVVVSNRRSHQVTDSESTSILAASVVAATWARCVRFV